MPGRIRIIPQGLGSAATPEMAGLWELFTPALMVEAVMPLWQAAPATFVAEPAWIAVPWADSTAEQLVCRDLPAPFIVTPEIVTPVVAAEPSWQAAIPL